MSRACDIPVMSLSGSVYNKQKIFSFYVDHFLSLKSVDPDEILHYATFYLGIDTYISFRPHWANI